MQIHRTDGQTAYDRKMKNYFSGRKRVNGVVKHKNVKVYATTLAGHPPLYDQRVSNYVFGRMEIHRTDGQTADDRKMKNYFSGRKRVNGVVTHKCESDRKT